MHHFLTLPALVLVSAGAMLFGNNGNILTPHVNALTVTAPAAPFSNQLRANTSVVVNGAKNIDRVTIGNVQNGGSGGHQLCSFNIPKDGVEEVVVYMNAKKSTVRGVKFYGKGGTLLGSALGSAVNRKDTASKSIGGTGQVVTSLSFTVGSRVDDISGSTKVRKP